MFDLASDLGLEYSPNSKHVDLYYDGEYRGTYLLSEKIQVGKGRVDIRNLEKEIGKWTKFLDVASTDWFAGDLEYVYNEGIMNVVKQQLCFIVL